MQYTDGSPKHKEYDIIPPDMAVYKVPQDVEADDKLIGPFSFRQFIYLIVVAISGAAAWGLSQVFIPLIIIPLPFIIFFAALALPLRKDQPMEAYLSAVVSFYFLKSRKRFWQPDGIDSFVTIIPPKDADRILTKDLNEDEATRRLNYLADLVDTHGWAIRGAGATPDTSISTDLYYESQQAPDMMDNSTPAAQAMTQHLTEEADEHRQEAIAGMQTAAKQAPITQAPVATTTTPTATTTPDPAPEPVSTLPSIDEIRARQEATMKRAAEQESRDAIAYATALAEEASDQRGVPVAQPTPAPAPALNNAVQQPVPAPATQTAATTSVSTPDTDTMVLTKQQADELSKQTDVSVQTLAGEANRIAEQNKILKSGDEVTISFR